MLYEFGLREPLKSSASEKCTVGLNGLVEFEMFSEPHVAAGDGNSDRCIRTRRKNPRRRRTGDIVTSCVSGTDASLVEMIG